MSRVLTWRRNSLKRPYETGENAYTTDELGTLDGD